RLSGVGTSGCPRPNCFEPLKRPPWMPLRVFSTLSNEKQDFVPLRPGRVGIYVCGITVYDLPHMGHARMLTAFDVMVRYLRWAGWQVDYVRNWTDVDGKIIRRAPDPRQDPKPFAAPFLEDGP